MSSFQPSLERREQEDEETVTRIGWATFYLGKQLLKLSTII